ncbi:replicative DNA helicase [Spirochaeta lutea]|uniref:Replicative DNA helicase n=1 Tax=Spirochaeta lutea TaxID=1480694 RepID=A0A098R119_9SPIO|nr:replicative DNA helicase [Spirochaeta lutea]KGE73800.1 DNA helicase [Spirochaeta lutea]
MEGRVPPHNNDAELATLGALLLDSEALGRIIPILRPEDFYRQAHQKVFQTIIDLSDRSEPIDLITVTDDLKAKKLIDSVGGPAFISQLTSIVPTSANIEYYARIVKESSVRRRLLRISAEISTDAYDESHDARTIVEEAERKIFEITDEQETVTFRQIRDLVGPALSNIEKVYKEKTSYSGIPSGFHELDDMLSGFQDAELIIVGARPSMGKTALALSMVVNVAIVQKIAAGFFTLEMSDQQIMQRIFAMVARIGSQSLRTGYLRPADLQSLVDAASHIYDAPLFIADTPNMKLLDLRAQARRMKAQFDVKIIFIDYLTLITAENKDIPRHEQIAEISRSLKSLARELNIPIVALSQVSRDTEGKVPTLANLRESGSIEQDADVVMFIHRERVGDRESAQTQEVIDTQLIVAKQRNGPVGTVHLAFLPSYTKFESLAPGENR